MTLSPTAQHVELVGGAPNNDILNIRLCVKQTYRTLMQAMVYKSSGQRYNGRRSVLRCGTMVHNEFEARSTKQIDGVGGKGDKIDKDPDN